MQVDGAIDIKQYKWKDALFSLGIFSTSSLVNENSVVVCKKLDDYTLSHYSSLGKR